MAPGGEIIGGIGDATCCGFVTGVLMVAGVAGVTGVTGVLDDRVWLVGVVGSLCAARPGSGRAWATGARVGDGRDSMGLNGLRGSEEGGGRMLASGRSGRGVASRYLESWEVMDDGGWWWMVREAFGFQSDLHVSFVARDGDGA